MPKLKRSPPQHRSRGTIKLRSEGKYLVRAYVGEDGRTGKRKYTSKVVEGTQGDAKKELTRILRDLDTDSHVEPSKASLKKYLEEWLEGKVDVTERTRVDYRQALRLYIYPILGLKPLGEIDKKMLVRWQTALIKQGLSPSTIEYVHGILKQAFREAVEDRLIPLNPIQKVKRPKKVRKEMQVLSPAQVSLFLEKTGKRWRDGEPKARFFPFYAVLLTAGLRPGEALGLKWDDLDGAFLQVRRAVTRVRGDAERGTKSKQVVKEPKTSSSNRRLRLPETTLDILEEHRRSQMEEMLKAGPRYKRQGFVFANSKGDPVDLNHPIKRWKELLEMLELPKIRLYDTRHTHITHLLLRKVHPKAASARAGHSSARITMDIYSHVMPEVEEEIAQMIQEDIYSQPKGDRRKAV